MQNRGWAVAITVVGAGLALACGGLGALGIDPEVTAALDAIDPTRLEAAQAVDPLLQLEGAGAPPGPSGNGVQVLQVAPIGVGRRALQVAVVFDRPMVALTELDTMSSSVPLSCDGGVAYQARWAGTTTAVLHPTTPTHAWPRATSVTCTVPAGTKAVDGVALENTITWTFETARPTVVGTTPSPDTRDFALEEPLLVQFDQPVDAAAVAPFVSLVDASGRLVQVRGVEADGENRIRILHAPLAKDTGYTLTIDEGVVGREGPLPMASATRIGFRTFPPLAIVAASPEGGQVNPINDLHFEFTTEVDIAEVSARLKLEPEPVDGWAPPEGGWSSRWYSYGVRLLPRTTYKATLAPGLVDQHGQTMEGRVWTFETGDYEPWLHVADGFHLYAANNPKELPLRHLNVGAVAVRIGRVSAEAAMGQTSEYAMASLLGADATRLDVPTEDEPNRIELDVVDLAPYLTDGHGLVAWEMVSPDLVDYEGYPRRYSGSVLVTDLGGTLKVSPGAVETWVTRLSDGRPVAGAEVDVYVGAVKVASGTTDADGLARFEGTPAPGWQSWDSDWPVRAVVRQGSDWTLVSSQWTDGIAPWQFGIYGGFDADGQQVVGHSFLERGVYKLGEPVYAKATFRLQTERGLEIPPAAQVHWVLNDPDGAEIASGDGQMDDHGGFSVKTQLPEVGALGTYTLEIQAKGEGWETTEYLYPPVYAYRAPAFRVSVDGPAEAVAGEKLQAVVDARYLFGAPLAKGEVTWRSWSVPEGFRPDGWDGWSFGPEDRWWEDGEQISGYGTGPNESAELSGGRHTFAMDLQKGQFDRPVHWFVEAEVKDTDRQVIANRATVLVHPSEWYLGLKPETRIPSAGEPAAIEVVGVSPDGTIRGGADASVKVVRRTWNRVREKGMDGRWAWVNTAVDEVLTEQSVRLGSSAQRVAFTPDQPGYYLIEGSAVDDLGNPVKATDSLYVSGAGFTSWALSDDQKMELVPDKARYRPGDTARILVKSPRPGLSALVTLEREGVLWRDVVQLDGTASVVEVPITSSHLPNVFVSVLAVTGEGPQDSPDKGRPDVRIGLVELEVDAASEHLAVSVATDEETYRPRDEVEVTVAVQREGAPVAGAGVTLYAVDEAILSLTAYETPEPHEVFYRHHEYSTVTADGRVVVLDRAPYLTKGAPRGGGGGSEESGPGMRSEFVTTIAWMPDLRTGPDGTVTASFTLPDNLTTFRIMAVADAEATGFGSADREIRVSRPIIARPALPRFLRAGDTAFAGVVVHNNTAWDASVDVKATVSGPAELTGAPVTVRVEAGGAVEVPFRIKGLEAGDAVFDFEVSGGGERDAVRWVVPVRRDLTYETVATTGTSTDRAMERIARPDGVVGGFGGLEIDVASTVLVGAGEGLAYLQDYPHGCVEQVTSRAMGSLYALQIKDAAGIETDEATLRANVDGVLRDLVGYQHWSGGLSYWKGGAEPSVMGTAYVVELMGRAREAGFAVDEARLGRHVEFLRAVLNNQHQVQYWDRLQTLTARAYVAVALARAGAGDAGHNNNLYALRSDLSVLGTASLLEAIARTTGPDARTEELERSIMSRTTIDAADASVKEGGGGRWARLWGSDDLSTAAALEALLVAKSEHVLAPKFARFLASARRDGRWHDTRATAGVLAALAGYAAKYEAAGQPVEVEVTLAGKELAKQMLSVPGAISVDVPMADVANGDLVFDAGGDGRFYYDARLRYVPQDPKPRDEGFTLRRSYELIDGGGEGGAVTSGATLRVTLQVITPAQRYAVAIVDPLPAGLEAVESSFATTSQAPGYEEEGGGDVDEYTELPDFGGSWVFDHHEIRDDQVRLYASDMPAGIHTWRYVVRATTPGTFEHPAATVEEMYEPENLGRTSAGTWTVGRGEVASKTP